jgi:hypothetical protein
MIKELIFMSKKKKLKKKLDELERLIIEVLSQRSADPNNHNHDRILRSLRSRKGHVRRKINEETERPNESDRTDGPSE